MFYLRKRIRNNFLHEAILSVLFLFLLLFSMLSIRLNHVNQEVNDILFERTGAYLILYGDINDVDGHIDNEENYHRVIRIYEEIADDLNRTTGNTVKMETYLQTNKVYTGEDIWDEDLYRFLFYDLASEAAIQKSEKKDWPVSAISLNIKDNKHYRSALEFSMFDPEQEEKAEVWTLNSMYPLFVGVNDSVFTDLYMNYLRIIEGRTFMQEEIEEGEKVIIVNQNAYLFEREGVRKVMVGDKIPITVDIDGETMTDYFEVIGINDGKDSSGISVVATETVGYSDEALLHNSCYHNMVYVPEKCLENIRDCYLDLCERYDVAVTKFSRFDNDPDYVYYSQHGGYRPAVITFNTIDDMEKTIDYLSDRIEDLNRASQRVIPYTYYSNIDSLTAVIGNIKNNEKIFRFLSIISTLSCIVVLSVLLINDMESSRKEIGIMVMIGKKKKDLILLKLSEYLLLSIIPIVLAFVLTIVLSNAYVSWLNDNILKISQENMIFGSVVTEIMPSINISDQLLIIVFYFCALVLACVFAYLYLRRMNIRSILMEGAFR